MKLVANFEIHLNGHLLFKVDKDTDAYVSFSEHHNEFDIDIKFILDKRGAVKGGKDHAPTFASNQVVLRLSRDELNIDKIESQTQELFEDVQDQYRKEAFRILNCFVRYFKYKLGNPGLEDITEYEYSDFDNPTWEDESGNAINPGIYTHSGSHSGGLHFYNSFNIKSYSDDTNERELKSALKVLYEPELYEEILADARAAIVQFNFRRAVLDMAIACELYVKKVFFKTDVVSNSVFDYLIDNKKIEVNVMDLLHKISKYVFGESFKEKYGKDYTNLDYLFRARNKIAHQGEAYYTDLHGTKKTIHDQTIKEWWHSLEKVFVWLESQKNNIHSG